LSVAPNRTGTPITQVLYGIENAVKLFSKVVSSANTMIDVCDDYVISHTLASHNVIEKQVLEIKAKLRYITEIKNDNIQYCKELMKVGQVRHLDGIRINFVVTDTEYTSSAIIQQVHAHPECVYSNVRSIVEQQRYLFENLWNKAIPAERKISEIEEGIEAEVFETITNHEVASQILVDLAKSVKKEALFFLPNDKAMVRIDKLGIVDHLIKASQKSDTTIVRVICPLSDENAEVTNKIAKNAPHIQILNGNNYNYGIYVVDNQKAFRVELKIPSADTFSEAIGFAVYSNRPNTVSFFRSVFELLWNERMLNEQLKLHDKMQKEFINIASHEMKTPTQAIIGYADLIQKHPEKRDDMMQALSRNAVRLQRLTNDILDVTRIDSNTLNLHKEQFNLVNLIANVVQDYVGYIEKENLNLKLFYNFKQDINDPLPIDADRDRITQVISNLLNNAIKFTSKKTEGIISVFAERKNSNQEEVIVSIKDTGEGINPEILPRLFTKFATRSFSGTGLGLYISKSIVEAHEGKMWAENNPDVKGATFTFTLPLSSRKGKHPALEGMTGNQSG
jgi:two-component system, OmpR family, sensor histidine kinase VicK